MSGLFVYKPYFEKVSGSFARAEGKNTRPSFLQPASMKNSPITWAVFHNFIKILIRFMRMF
jgi:hypothetical protein